MNGMDGKLIFAENELPCQLCDGKETVVVSRIDAGPNDTQLDECPWCLRRKLNSLHKPRPANPEALNAAIKQLGELSASAWEAAEKEEDGDLQEIDESFATIWGQAKGIVENAVNQLGLVTVANAVVLPNALTAENGAKCLLIGEFHEEQQVMNPLYTGDEDDDEPEYITSAVVVSWTTIKKIYAAIVNSMAKPLTHYCDSSAAKQ
jgi:hypothetical protein